MIGRKDSSKLKDQLVLEKLETLNVNDIYDIPNVFQTITRVDKPSSSAWISLMSHPFTPSYIRLNLPAYIQAVNTMVLAYKEDREFVKECLQYLHKRVVYEKNRKRVFVAVVENILPYLLDNHADPDSRAVLDDVVLSKEALSLLEAYLTAKMPNYTSVLVQQAKSLELTQSSTIFEILCSVGKSKKSNKMLLRWYVEACGFDVDKNEALLGVIRKYRIYQVEEDKEQGYNTSAHFSSLLSSLSSDEYCRAAVAILPLNHSVVTLELALLQCNDKLLAELTLTYFKIGKLLLLLQQVILRFNPCISLGNEFRSQLSDVGSKLPEQQFLNIVELLSTTLKENTVVSNDQLGSDESEGSHDNPKRQKVADQRLCWFVANCASILLSQCTMDLPTDVVVKLYNITKSLPAEAGRALKLFFNSAVIFDRIPSIRPFDVSENLPDSHEEEVKLLIKSLHYCDNTTEKLDQILSFMKLYPEAILSNFLIIYNHMITDHMVTVATYLTEKIRESSWFIESEVFSRCTDLHSAIVSCVLRDVSGIEERFYLEPLSDISLSSARDIIKTELSSSPRNLTVRDCVDKLYLLSQLSLNSCYHRLLITTWLLRRQIFIGDEREANPRDIVTGGVVSYLGRFCKPPPPHTPLPAVYGKYSGQILSEILSFGAAGAGDFVAIFLGVGVSMSSADLSHMIKYLGTCLVQHASIVGMLVKELCGNETAASRYHEDLVALRGHILKTIIDSDLAPRPMTDVIAQCELLCAAHDIECCLSESSVSSDLLPVCFEIALSLLKSPLLGVEYKLKLTQNLLDNVSEDKVPDFTEALLNHNTELYLFDEKKVDLNTSSKSYIETLIACLPNRNAEYLIHHTKFDPGLVETVSSPSVPVSLIPKFINKLTKVQVMKSLSEDCGDPHLLSKCLLCLVQHNYPLHLLNSIYSSILKVLANEQYETEPQTVSNIVRASDLLSKQKEVARHHVPYILCTVFEFVSKSNPTLVKDITPAVYPLFDVCLVQGLQYLQARLSQPARQLFLQLQSHYKQNIKYQGKT